MTRDEALARLAYAPEWREAGVLDDALLEEQIRIVAVLPERERDSPEHFRWTMWQLYARRELRWDKPAPTRDHIERLLALDLAEASAPPPNLGHAIVHAIASGDAPLGRAAIERLSAHPIRGSRVELERHLLRRALELEEENHWRPERPLAMQLRRDSLHRRPSELLRGHESALEAMLDLSSAWDAPLRDLLAAGAFVRAEIDADAADAALTPVLRRHEASWSLALRIADALERDVIDRALYEDSRTSLIRAISHLMKLTGLGLGEVKSLLGAIERLSEGRYEPGVLSRLIAEERERRRREDAQRGSRGAT